MKIKSKVGYIDISGELNAWTVSTQNEIPESGLEYIHFKLESESPAIPPVMKLAWVIPQLDMQVRWHPACRFNRYIPAEWAQTVESNLAQSAPVMQFSNTCGNNRLLFAVSEALRMVKINAGVCEATNEIACTIEMFSIPEAPLSSYEFTLMMDTREIFYADAIRDSFSWFASLPEYTPTSTPEAAFDPIYSTWYSYHQELFDDKIEAECQLSPEYGLKGIIVDDGWQTDDNNGGYAFCGDWELSKRRFPDMPAHVASVQKLNMKYMMWYSVPFVGEKSKNLKRFEGKFLYKIDRLQTYVLDPRFPEVREFLIDIYVNAVKEWNIDGLKLDFINNFHFKGEDPAVKENYAGRDIKSVPLAVDKLLSDALMSLKKIKPEILIEFRQSYIGPAIRKYGNMLRSSDCPADILTNRLNTIDLRLISGNTAVHADMLEWNLADTAENAALQILNIIFSVPQISVRLAELPDSHRKMLRFWLDFWLQHRDVLMTGKLTPLHPEMNYPLVIAENEQEKVIAVYGAGQCIDVTGKQGQSCYIINACGTEELVLKLDTAPKSSEIFNTMGENVSNTGIGEGFCIPHVPCSGLLRIQF